MLRFAITSGQLRPSLGAVAETEPARQVVARCSDLAAGGVDFVLIREKALDGGALAAVSRDILTAVRAAGASTKVLIARRLDVALAVGADGVHLSAAPGELTAAQVRQLMPGAFVSVSCHTLAEVERARDAGASAILFGPVFGKVAGGVEVVRGIGLEGLREACALAAPTPVFALGGVTQAAISDCKSAGASGIAAIRLFFSS